MNKKNKCPILCYRLGVGIGTILAGMGTIGLGIGAWIAASETGTILEKMADIKETGANIEKMLVKIDSTNKRLEDNSREIKRGVQWIEKIIRINSSVDTRKQINKDTTREKFNTLLEKRYSYANRKVPQEGISLYMENESRKELVERFANKEIDLKDLENEILTRIKIFHRGDEK